MASLLRQIVAGPRARHPEAGLDLCYVTDNIIATSGPSGTYPQRAYRNPLDALVKFLDEKHGDDWAIWEFRAEGTGYPDSEVYNRVYHYPFPDHHPPPFALIPNIMASMRNWLQEKEGRVVVVHCKAGKGRSGTASCSYLISEEGWPVQKALQRFTERRMRPNMGKGVSIPSQLRWIGYVDRWKRNKLYVERQVEIVEVHCWGLRDGVKIQVEGFVEDGKLIKNFHTFTREEREIVRGEVKATSMTQAVQEVMYKNGLGRTASKKEQSNPREARAKASDSEEDSPDLKASLDGAAGSKPVNQQKDDMVSTGDVMFRPTRPVILPSNDVNIDIERRNKAAFDLTMVTAVAHVWFNTYFEGNGPEQNGNADEGGVFEIDWDAMDGIKGSSRRGTQAFEKIAIVWKALKAEDGKVPVVITEPKQGEEVKQSSPADWTGRQGVTPSEGKDLGLRTASPTDSNTDVSKASSIQEPSTETKPKQIIRIPGRNSQDSDRERVQPHIPDSEESLSRSKESNGGSGSGSGAGSRQDVAPTAALSSQHDGTTHSMAGDNAGQRVQSPKSYNGGAEGTSSRTQHISADGPADNRLEDLPKTVKEHTLGHIGKKKEMSS
ncbi:phosphatidylinositol-3,4,5-trisphosphate 3-phosphatase [Massarina eburnea CBS 473.64]|uniref:phosphatidylinositol-3,4,5-trisphosphate 3-phosphatase n=1 Tax=Massarina eburnea CBS 473.64 TaxID=1395130 RepID=A0A6A6RWI9_9PLEO|nr:phosphatidylinositol-3,4,5-trisphosphate 3-phosphatase [Massarina eburnea CBS 473.64]